MKRWLLVFVGLGMAFRGSVGLASDDLPHQGHPDPQTLEVGRQVYEQHCAICHGLSGDGNGMAAYMFRAKPRDFRAGIFKFRSTPTGSLPTDEDLFQTISRGLRGTGMIAHQDHLQEAERRAVVAYLKTFSERFQRQRPQAPIPLPEPPPRTPELMAKGREIYQKAECFKCHGTKGRGDGPSALGLKDSWGVPIQPSDLTRSLKRGSTPKAIYQTLVTGLDGSPMPLYQDALSEEELWALAYYVASLNTGALSRLQVREERAGQMVVRMHGGRHGRMRHRMPMRHDMPMMR